MAMAFKLPLNQWALRWLRHAASYSKLSARQGQVTKPNLRRSYTEPWRHFGYNRDHRAKTGFTTAAACRDRG